VTSPAFSKHAAEFLATNAKVGTVSLSVPIYPLALTDRATSGWSLALIGNASGQTVGVEGVSIRGVFDKETRRKPLAFAADAVRYGI
jgi:hypothetical protein